MEWNRLHDLNLDQDMNMPSITIDNLEYDTDTLSPEARQQLEMLEWSPQGWRRIARRKKVQYIEIEPTTKI